MSGYGLRSAIYRRRNYLLENPSGIPAKWLVSFCIIALAMDDEIEKKILKKLILFMIKWKIKLTRNIYKKKLIKRNFILVNFKEAKQNANLMTARKN